MNKSLKRLVLSSLTVTTMGMTLVAIAQQSPKPEQLIKWRQSAYQQIAWNTGRNLINAVIDGFLRERVGMHVCRGNWSHDESAAPAGDYRLLLPLFQQIRVGTYLLALATPRAGEIEVLRDLPQDCRIGVGVVNQKLDRIETVEEVMANAERAIAMFGPERVMLNPDCGFATFADNPLASSKIAEGKLKAITDAAARLRDKYKV